MPKNKSKSSDEWLRGKIREQAKEIRQLRKQLKYHQKQAYGVDQDEEIVSDSEDTHPKIYKKTCPHCGKGELKIFELIGRIFEECNVCDHREKLS